MILENLDQGKLRSKLAMKMEAFIFSPLGINGYYLWLPEGCASDDGIVMVICECVICGGHLLRSGYLIHAGG